MADEIKPDPNAKPETVEVDFGTAKIIIPKAQADAVIAERQRLKDESRKLNERMGVIEAERKAAADAVEKAKQDADREKAIKAGDIDEVRRIERQGADAKVSRLADRLRDASLRSAIALIPDLVDDAQAIDDIAAQLRQSCRFNPETDQVEVMDAAGRPVLGADGKPKSADAYVSEFVAARPYFRKANGTAGSGASGTGGKPAAGKTITESDFTAASPKDRSRMMREGYTIKG